MLFFHHYFPQASLSLAEIKKAEDAVGIMQEHLRVANIEGLNTADQPYFPALQTWHYRFSPDQLFSSVAFHPFAISSWILHDILRGSDICVIPTLYGMIMVSR